MHIEWNEDMLYKPFNPQTSCSLILAPRRQRNPPPCISAMEGRHAGMQKRVLHLRYWCYLLVNTCPAILTFTALSVFPRSSLITVCKRVALWNESESVSASPPRRTLALGVDAG